MTYLLIGTPGSLETWLLLRSLRTLTIRLKAQNETANKLAQWLASEDCTSVTKVLLEPETIHYYLRMLVWVLRRVLDLMGKLMRN